MKNYSEIERLVEREPDPAFARRARIILSELNLGLEEKVLDAGCGRGFYLRALKTIWPKVDIYGVDVNKKYLSQARKMTRGMKINFVESSILNLPFEKNFFDAVLASEILEHIKDDKKAISEIYRVLKPKGTLIVTVPNQKYPFLWDPLNWILERFFKIHTPSNIWWLAGIWADHVRLYSKKELVAKLKKSGFKVDEVLKTTYYCLPFSHLLLYGIGKNLVEVGLMKDFNRFSSTTETSVLNKLLLWPVRFVDRFNEGRSFKKSSLNIIVKATKE